MKNISFKARVSQSTEKEIPLSNYIISQNDVNATLSLMRESSTERMSVFCKNISIDIKFQLSQHNRGAAHRTQCCVISCFELTLTLYPFFPLLLDHTISYIELSWLFKVKWYETFTHDFTSAYVCEEWFLHCACCHQRHSFGLLFFSSLFLHAYENIAHDESEKNARTALDRERESEKKFIRKGMNGEHPTNNFFSPFLSSPISSSVSLAVVDCRESLSHSPSSLNVCAAINSSLGLREFFSCSNGTAFCNCSVYINFLLHPLVSRPTSECTHFAVCWFCVCHFGWL